MIDKEVCRWTGYVDGLMAVLERLIHHWEDTKRSDSESKTGSLCVCVSQIEHKEQEIFLVLVSHIEHREQDILYNRVNLVTDSAFRTQELIF